MSHGKLGDAAPGAESGLRGIPCALCSVVAYGCIASSYDRTGRLAVICSCVESEQRRTDEAPFRQSERKRRGQKTQAVRHAAPEVDRRGIRRIARWAGDLTDGVPKPRRFR